MTASSSLSWNGVAAMRSYSARKYLSGTLFSSGRPLLFFILRVHFSRSHYR